MRFAFIHGERAHFPISALCRILEVTRSGEGDRGEVPANRRGITSAEVVDHHR